MPFDPKKAREKFAALQTECNQFMEKFPEDGENRPSDEEFSANGTRIEGMKTLQKQIDQHQQFAALKLENPTATAVPGTVTTPVEPGGREEFSQIAVSLSIETKEQGEQRFSLHKAAVNHFIRTGEHKRVMFNNNAITTGTGSNAMLPVSVAPPIVIKRLVNPLRQALAARGLVAITTDSSEPISVPFFDDSANAADVIPQNQTPDNEKEPSVTSLQLGNTLYDSGTVWSSNTLLNSLSFDLLAYIQPMLDSRIDIKQATAWMTSIKATAPVGVTTASTGGVTFPELLTWQHSVPIVNRPYGVFVLSDTLFRGIRGLVDNQNRPIYQESLQDGAPDKLLGWPIFVSTDLADPGPGQVSGLAVAANRIFIRDITNRRVARYVNDADRRDQFGLAEFANGDFQFHPSGVRALKHAAA